MKPSLQDQLKMVWREAHPNCVVVLQNNIENVLDFRKFKVITNVNETKPKKELRYKIELNGLNIRVSDLEDNRMVFEAICSAIGIQRKLIKKLKKEYVPYIIQECGT